MGSWGYFTPYKWSYDLTYTVTGRGPPCNILDLFQWAVWIVISKWAADDQFPLHDWQMSNRVGVEHQPLKVPFSFTSDHSKSPWNHNLFWLFPGILSKSKKWYGGLWGLDPIFTVYYLPSPTNRMARTWTWGKNSIETPNLAVKKSEFLLQIGFLPEFFLQ